MAGGGGAARRADIVVQERPAGLIPVRRAADRLSFAAASLILERPCRRPSAWEIASALRIDVRKIVEAAGADNGPGWVAVLLESADSLDPGFVDLDLGVAGPYPDGSLHRAATDPGCTAAILGGVDAAGPTSRVRRPGVFPRSVLGPVS